MKKGQSLLQLSVLIVIALVCLAIYLYFPPVPLGVFLIGASIVGAFLQLIHPMWFMFVFVVGFLLALGVIG